MTIMGVERKERGEEEACSRDGGKERELGGM